ncbi:hypothetical protein ATCC90586_007694 [Pythium insidiosum]|nr:hypothetical protein ATCC90586_007694 [Pythium insidiosum]
MAMQSEYRKVAAPPPKLSRDEWERCENQALERGDASHPCSICREAFGVDEQVILSCSHMFHLACIQSFERVGQSADRLLRAIHAHDDSIDSLLAQFDETIHLSRKVFDPATRQGEGTCVCVHAGAGSPERAPESPASMDDSDAKADAVLLSCSHVFHRECLGAFEEFNIYEVPLCPLCRAAYARRAWADVATSVGGPIAMDLDANAEDFFAALNSGDAEAFVDFSSLPEPDPVDSSSKAAASHAKASGTHHPANDKKKKSDASTKKNSKKQDVPARAPSKGHKASDHEPTLPMEERIVNLLVPELKVNDVMQLIKKMKQAGKSDADEFSELDADQKTAPRFRCETCGNIEQNNFITDYARGDTICNGIDGRGCGTVVQDHIVHEGSAYRKFEGEEDKSHHGPAPNKLFSSGHNLRTLISQDGEMAGNLRRAAEFVEMNLSQMGKDERRTRIGYKDQSMTNLSPGDSTPGGDTGLLSSGEDPDDVGPE